MTDLALPPELVDAEAAKLRRKAQQVLERLAAPDAFLSRGDLSVLGLERRAIDAVFRSCSVVAIPGYSRPLILVRDFRAWREEHTYAKDRVRPT